MNQISGMGREDFEALVEEHRRLIRMANELEYQLHRLGQAPTAQQVTECQRVAGGLIGLLRSTLYRHDQQVLPALEALVAEL
jgi:hypothetical protein